MRVIVGGDVRTRFPRRRHHRMRTTDDGRPRPRPWPRPAREVRSSAREIRDPGRTRDNKTTISGRSRSVPQQCQGLQDHSVCVRARAFGGPYACAMWTLRPAHHNAAQTRHPGRASVRPTPRSDSHWPRWDGAISRLRACPDVRATYGRAGRIIEPLTRWRWALD
ncbi:hypothetical protein OH76DRAFT_653507 [Lentinus brumalis]|uniref:Uncharacterized protein n=1 Tax=Lentinus brumalis TaxID=2498619 RepID=A0A371D7E0_9APHY|nr:hypothetical protein OH76DRAFT_653507 [Polyporus brumalis]